MKKKTVIQVCGKDVKIHGKLIRIACLDGEKFTAPDDPKVMAERLRNCGRRIDLFTFLQRLPETSPKYTYPLEWDNLAVLPIIDFDNWFKKQIRSDVRNRARQAERRGVVMREVQFDDALVRGICEIYNESPVRQGRRFPHYGMTLDQAREYAGTFLDRSVFIGAFFANSMIGFVKCVIDETQTYGCMIHILSMLRHRDKAPTNALVGQAVRSCASRGLSFLVYENFAYGKKRADSLSRFKEINGFNRMDLPRYYIPLTAAGSIALRFGLHHNFLDRLPEPLLAKLREVRAAWYTRKLRSSLDAT